MSENPYQSPRHLSEQALKPATRPAGADSSKALGCLLALLTIPAGAIAGGTLCARSEVKIEYRAPLAAVPGLLVAIPVILGMQFMLHRMIDGDWSWRPNYIPGLLALAIAAPVAYGVYLGTSEEIGVWVYSIHRSHFSLMPAYAAGMLPFSILSAALWLGLHWPWNWLFAGRE